MGCSGHSPADNLRGTLTTMRVQGIPWKQITETLNRKFEGNFTEVGLVQIVDLKRERQIRAHIITMVVEMREKTLWRGKAPPWKMIAEAVNQTFRTEYSHRSLSARYHRWNSGEGRKMIAGTDSRFDSRSR